MWQVEDGVVAVILNGAIGHLDWEVLGGWCEAYYWGVGCEEISGGAGVGNEGIKRGWGT